MIIIKIATYSLYNTVTLQIMTWRFSCPPLSSPLFPFNVKFNEIISWIENILPFTQC